MKQLKLKNETEIEIMDCDLPEVYTWTEAIELCSLIGPDWRLPSVIEIIEIFNDKNKYNFAELGYWAYWTCEIYNSERAKCLNGPNGEIAHEKKDAKFYIRLVRTCSKN